MFDKERKRTIISLIINSLIVIFEIVALIMRFSYDKTQLFKFYTRDSNLLLLIVSFVMMVDEVLSLLIARAIPRWVYFSKYVATGLTTLTFLVVVFILCPMEIRTIGPKIYLYMLLNKEMLFHHLICPILAFVSFVFFERKEKMGIKESLLALIPTLVYGFTTVILVLLNVEKAPYPFLDLHNQAWYMDIIWPL